MTKIIGVDVGTKRVGIAYGEIDGGFAFPLKVIPVQRISDTIDQLADDIIQCFFEVNTIATTSPQTSIAGDSIKDSQRIIVLGDSKNFKGRDNPIMAHVHRLKEALEKRGFTISLIPEFMTSAEASRFQGDHKLLDASAATIILQSYFDTQKGTKHSNVPSNE
jgi:RNase H-fold protein (predicted Holliday junction resolvase)